MDKKEFAQFAMALKTYFPREQLLPNNQAMELWFRMLQDIDYKIAEIALTKWVATNKWSPSIAEIRSMAAEITVGSISDWGEGWEQVLTAIRKYGMYQVDEAMNSFDEITREACKRLGFQNICMSENINQDRANFRMIYEQLAERQKADNQIPAKLRVMIGSVQQNQAMIEQKGDGYEG